jgi:hypothetical protein
VKRLRASEIEDCYLTPEAKKVIKAYQELGVKDPDLAVELAIRTLSEERVFELPEREKLGSPGE